MSFKVVILACAVLAVASAGIVAPLGAALVRTPSLDSAVIKSERLGGNFAYSSVEGHAYAAVSPVISHVPTPVAVSYSAHPVAVAAPAIAAYHAPLAGVHHNLLI